MNREEGARLAWHPNRRHGQASPGNRGPAYRSWESMKSRCNNPNDPSFPDYGGRGISVFPAWADSFEAFDKDMGERPRGTTLDRIDVNRNYEPGNCRWADAKTQGRNKRSNQRVEWQGQTMTMVELSECTGVPYQRLHERIVRRGWSVARAVSEAPRGWRQQQATPPGPHPMSAGGEAVAVDEREELLGYVDACADKLSREGFPIMGRTLKTAVRCLATPPATIPVEALEGLVADLRNEAGDWAGGDVRAAYARIADRIELLIKERSNGR